MNDTSRGGPCVRSPGSWTTLDLDSEAKGTALHMAKMMERQGGDPRLWAERWLREKGIERDSRTGHELSVLTNASTRVASTTSLTWAVWGLWK